MDLVVSELFTRKKNVFIVLALGTICTGLRDWEACGWVNTAFPLSLSWQVACGLCVWLYVLSSPHLLSIIVPERRDIETADTALLSVYWVYLTEYCFREFRRYNFLMLCRFSTYTLCIFYYFYYKYKWFPSFSEKTTKTNFKHLMFKICCFVGREILLN